MSNTVFLACTHPLQPTGYARVGCALANGLSRLGWRVVVYGFQNLAPIANRTIDPNVTILDVGKITGDSTGFGETAWADLVCAMNPDVAIIYNDVFVINAYLDALKTTTIKTKLVAYVDLVHDNQHPQLLQRIADRVDQVWVFSQHWTQVVHHTSVHVIPHGLDECFVPIHQEKARVMLNLPLDGYIVLNSNRNSYRKALDVSIRIFLDAFVQLKCPDDLYLFLNCTSCETGYDIPALISRECARLGLDFDVISSKHILGMRNSGFLSDDILNVLYNACDVGLNTSVGEGFGLMALEMGSLRKPLLINATGGARDLMGSEAVQPIETLELCRGFIAHGGTMDIPDSREMTRRLVDLYTTKCRSKDPPFECSEYAWDTVCARASAVLLTP
jgi:hypothetical protein